MSFVFGSDPELDVERRLIGRLGDERKRQHVAPFTLLALFPMGALVPVAAIGLLIAAEHAKRRFLPAASSGRSMAAVSASIF
jgi:hypothetical protein